MAWDVGIVGANHWLVKLFLLIPYYLVNLLATAILYTTLHVDNASAVKSLSKYGVKVTVYNIGDEKSHATSDGVISAKGYLSAALASDQNDENLERKKSKEEFHADIDGLDESRNEAIFKERKKAEGLGTSNEQILKNWVNLGLSFLFSLFLICRYRGSLMRLYRHSAESIPLALFRIRDCPITPICSKSLHIPLKY
ncbi:MAG: hypothetical protein VXZ72_05415 [Chlamydiota bacterium]|nr:hypothetical protein [Chlamydiota bacterium]